MTNFQSTGSDVIRRIVSDSSDIDNPQPTLYTNNSLTIPHQSEVYVCFAAEPTTGDWVADGDTGWFQMGVLAQFHFENEPTVLRTITLPVQSMRSK